MRAQGGRAHVARDAPRRGWWSMTGVCVGAKTLKPADDAGTQEAAAEAAGVDSTATIFCMLEWRPPLEAAATLERATSLD